MSDDELWAHEQRFWLDRVAFCEQHLAPDALVVLPKGIVARGTGLETLGDTLPWINVALSNRHCVHPTAHLAMLAYEAAADRGDESTASRAYCSSTYLRANGRWLLAAHHQTRIGDHERRLVGLDTLRIFFAPPSGEGIDSSHNRGEAQPRQGYA